MSKPEDSLAKKLQVRESNGLLRSLKNVKKGLVDFASNDYLGFAKSLKQKLDINKFSCIEKEFFIGSSGSRLLTGNSEFVELLEKQIALHHKAESALIFNSGYDANLGFFSCIPQKGDTVLFDELIHASVRDGVRLGLAEYSKFKHNGIAHLEEKLKTTTGQVYVAVESVYSMDGDFAPLEELVAVCEKHNAALIVDEAHATGLYGTNGAGRVEEFGLEKKVFARLHTFGKALGCHGAAVVGSEVLRQYLINFCRPFIYSTALPIHSLQVVKIAYSEMSIINDKILYINKILNLFRKSIKVNKFELLPSNSPIQCIIISGNENVRNAANQLQEKAFHVLPILSPTVKAGEERLRICLHAFNTEEEVVGLAKAINEL